MIFRIALSLVAAPFGPADIAGLALRLGADSLALADGDPVSLWGDRSGHGRDATATGPGRPTYKAGVLNGLPAVGFDGLANRLTLPLGVPSLPRFSVFVVHRGEGMLCGSTADPAHSRYLWSRASAGLLSTYFGGGFRDYPVAGLGSFGVTSVTYDGATATCHRGMTPAGSDADPAAPGLAIDVIGEYGHAAGPLPLRGDIAEFLVYDSALSDPDRLRVVAHLAAKYAL